MPGKHTSDLISSIAQRAVEMPKPTVVEVQTSSKIKYVLVQSLIDAHFKYTGRASGKLYEWPKAGSIMAVQEEDVSDLLSKRLGAKSCCGGEDTNKIFQLAT